MPGPKDAASPKRDSLNIRIRPEERELIERAAAVTGKTRAGFVLEAALQAAEDALLDCTQVPASPARLAAFLERLDAPPAPNARLRRSLKQPAPWG